MRIEAETNLFVAKANFYFVLGASCVARFTNSSREILLGYCQVFFFTENSEVLKTSEFL